MARWYKTFRNNEKPGGTPLRRLILSQTGDALKCVPFLLLECGKSLILRTGSGLCSLVSIGVFIPLVKQRAVGDLNGRGRSFVAIGIDLPPVMRRSVSTSGRTERRARITAVCGKPLVTQWGIGAGASYLSSGSPMGGFDRLIRRRF